MRANIVRGWIALTALLLLFIARGSAGSGGTGVPPYSYFYQGRLVTLTPSTRLVTAPAAGPQATAVAQAGLRPLPGGQWAALADSNQQVYRLPPAAKGTPSGMARERFSAAARRLGIRGVQPVFESDDLRIPSDAVIVGFRRATTLDQARRLLGFRAPALGLIDVRPLATDAFLVRILQPEDGRAFGVSRSLAALPFVRYAEPNLLRLTTDTSDAAQTRDLLLRAGLPTGVFRVPQTDLHPLDPTAGARQADYDRLASPTWIGVVTETFENGAPGWFASHVNGFALADPAVTSFRARAGTKSVYMTGSGVGGKAPPGPYPAFCKSVLESPTFSLAGMEDALVNFWFYAKYETPGDQLYDLCAVNLYNTQSGEGQTFELLNVAYTGDLTADPTTINGWRHCVFRVPPRFRTANMRVQFVFISDYDAGAEGVYIDDFFVAGTTDVDTNPISNDAYSARQYELKNAGQFITGNDTQDMNVPEAWAVQAVSSSIVVAVIDSGVDLSHPDLNLVQGYDAETQQAGGAPDGSPGSYHGTGCAGNIGAKRDNGIGVAGVAAGVKIMPIRHGSDAASVRAFDYAVANGAKVMSCSWRSASQPSQAITDAIGRALTANRIVLAACGNGPDRPPYTYDVMYPARGTANQDIIAVGATGILDDYKGAASSDGLFSWGSSYVGAGPDVCAPGPWSYTTDIRGSGGGNTDSSNTGIDADYLNDFGGTSSATPKVAGVVALMCSKNPNLTPAQVKSILRSTAKDIGEAGVDDRTGAGRVDALAAVNAVSANSTFSISGTVTQGGNGLSGVTVTASPGGTSVNTAAGGTYTLNGLAAGTYTVTPAKVGFTFNPTSRSVTVGPDASGKDFVATAQAASTITVTAPNGGENWTIDTNQAITWTSSNVSGNVKIELSRDGGATYSTLFAATANDGTENWTVAAPASNSALLRITSVNDGSVSDVGNAAFTISEPQSGNSPAVFRLQSASVAPGGLTTLNFGLETNGAQITVAIFDLLFDTSKVTWVKSDKASLPGAVSVDTNPVNGNNGRIRHVLQGGATPWSTGTILSIQMRAAQGVASGSQTPVSVFLRDTVTAGVRVTDPNSVSKNATALPSTLTFGQRADVSGDGFVDGTDIQIVVNAIIGRIPEDRSRQDVNNDGYVDGSDIQTIINVILGRAAGQGSGGRSNAVFTVGSGVALPGGTAEIGIDYRSGGARVSNAVFDLLYDPRCFREASVSASGLPDGAQLVTAVVTPGRLRCLVYQTDGGGPWKDGNLLRLTLTARDHAPPGSTSLRLAHPGNSRPGARIGSPEGSSTLAASRPGKVLVTGKGSRR